MLITAKIFAKAEAKNERQAKTEVSSEPGARSISHAAITPGLGVERHSNNSSRAER
jgi:hypothetical protein